MSVWVSGPSGPLVRHRWVTSRAHVDHHLLESLYVRQLVGLVAYTDPLFCSLMRANNVASCGILMDKMHSIPGPHGYLTIIILTRLMKLLLFSGNTMRLANHVVLQHSNVGIFKTQLCLQRG